MVLVERPTSAGVRIAHHAERDGYFAFRRPHHTRSACMSEPSATPARKPETWRELGYLFTFLRPYRLAFRSATAASLISMTFGAAFPLLLRYLIDAALYVTERP